MAIKIYLIPGLAFDDTIFSKLDFGDYAIEYLNWIEPSKKERIHDYAKRLFPDAHQDNDQKTIIIGHSFGGVMAQEIAHHRSVDLVILLGSIKDPTELPLHFKLLKGLGLYSLFSKKLSIKTLPLWGGLHDFDGEDKKAFLVKMINRFSDQYLKWALKSLLYWKKKSIHKTTKLIQIHGENDRTFPISKIKNPDYIIKGGSHIMLYTKAVETNNIILKVIEDRLK